MIVLDTNVVSEISRLRPDGNVLDWLRRQDSASLSLTSPSVMEQSYGAERKLLRDGSDKYLRLFNDIVLVQFRGKVLPFTEPADRLAGQLRAQRERTGRALSIGDAMIAAICLSHGATLATRNVRDFEGLGLGLINPFEPQQ